MIDKTLVTSGYDTEILLSESYLKYILLSLYEIGTIPGIIPINDTKSIFLYPPPELTTQRLYEVNPNYNNDPFELFSGAEMRTADAFEITYSPYKADTESGKILYLLTLSKTEFNSVRSASIKQLIDELEETDAEVIRTKQ